MNRSVVGARRRAAGAERTRIDGRVGILPGGSVYGCVFTGGAENSLFSFDRLTRPSSPGVPRGPSGFLVLGWVLLKGIGQTMVELAKFVGRCVADPRGAGRRWEWTTIKLGISVWIRQFFTTFIAYQDASAPAHRRQL